ncbi:MAG: proteasome accessory factor PafA2 family protein [Planctomycetota bacterium]
MHERVIGMETEYGFSSLCAGGKPYSRGKALALLMSIAWKRLCSLRGRGMKGLFLENGARVYVDIGDHLEYCTPECTDPWELVRQLLAGDRILAELAGVAVGQDPELASASFFKTNVDYSGARTTWGSHENYLHRASPLNLAAVLVPHLVSRVIYTGAGGFDVGSPGLVFSLSPRVHHLQGVISKESTGRRGIVHSKDESLSSDGYHRLHLICGESLSSHRAAWLKVATTALVVALVEAGIASERGGLKLRGPLGAMEVFSRDTACRERVPLAPGIELTAAQIQRHYLELAEGSLDSPFMPPWAEAICREWRRVLDALDEDPEGLSRTLDWRIKLSLYRDHARRRGFPPERVTAWNDIVAGLETARGKLGKARSGEDDPVPLVDLALSTRSPIRAEVKELDPLLRKAGLAWSELPSFLELRQELFELDMRFGQLGEEGIFQRLDEAGLLEHRVEGVRDIDRARREPPPTSRARLRGETIRRLRRQRKKAESYCDWRCVWDLKRKKRLDLSDPFATEERWSPMPDPDFTDEPPPDICSVRSLPAGLRDLLRVMRHRAFPRLRGRLGT